MMVGIRFYFFFNSMSDLPFLRLNNVSRWALKLPHLEISLDKNVGDVGRTKGHSNIVPTYTRERERVRTFSFSSRLDRNHHPFRQPR